MPEHPVLIDMLEEGHLLLLGTTGAGKTYQQRGFLERLRRADRRDGAIDKLGNHWGLTLSADGQRPGLDFIIFGGKRAHVPMTPADGARLGRLFVERNIPAIFDVSQWLHDEQQAWMADFAEAVFVHNEGALHLGLDEAQSWVPQGGGGDDAFRPVLRLAEQGRGNGIRLMMAAQRLSRIDKSAVGMASIVIAMRQTGTADRKAMRDLLAADSDQMAMIEKGLPGLPTGTGFVWDPLKGSLDLHSFPENSTFDSSRTPRHGDAPPAPIAVSGMLVEELRQLLAPGSTEDRAAGGAGTSEARDAEIERLCARINQLGDELNAVRRQTPVFPAVQAEIRTALDDFGQATGRLRRAIDAAFDAARKFPEEFSSDQERLDDLGSVQDGRHKCPRTGPGARREVSAERTPAATGVTAGETAPSPAALAIAELLDRVSPAKLTWAQAAALTGRKASGGNFNAARKWLRASFRIIEHGDLICSAVPAPRGLSREQAIELWKSVLTSPAPKMIEALEIDPPKNRAELGVAIGAKPTGGNFNNGLAQLRRNGLLTPLPDGRMRLAARLPGEDNSESERTD